MTFRREYKMNNLRGKVQVIGSKAERPRVRPYLRIESQDGRYLGSVDGRALYHLRNALDIALTEEIK